MIVYISFILGFYPSSLLFLESLFICLSIDALFVRVVSLGACRLSKFGVKSKSKSCKMDQSLWEMHVMPSFCVVCTRTHCPFIYTPKLSETSAQWMGSGYPRVNSATKGRAQTFISHTIRSILQVLIFGIALNLLTLHAPQWRQS